MSRRRPPTLAFVFLLAAASPCAAVEFLSKSEMVERELERKKAAPPVLVYSSARLRLWAVQGRNASARRTIRNDGGQTLNWRVSSAPPWIDVAPANGALGYGEKQTVTVTARTAGLQPGTEQGTIVIEAEGASGSPASVSVSVNVRAARVEDDAEDEPEPRRSGRGRRGGRSPEPDVRREDRRTSRPRLGVHAGLVVPGLGDDGFKPGFLFGGQYRRPLRGKYGVSSEVGVDLFRTEATDGLSSTFALTGRFGLLFGVAASPALGDGYLLAGPGVLLDFTESGTGAVGVLDLGAGYVLRGGRTDLRLRYSLLVGSRNAIGLGAATVGWRF